MASAAPSTAKNIAKYITKYIAEICSTSAGLALHSSTGAPVGGYRNSDDLEGLCATGTHDARPCAIAEGKATRGTRTPDLRFTKAQVDSRKANDPRDLPHTASERATPGATPSAESGTDDPDLAAVIDAWPTLPKHLRQSILAFVDAAGTAT